MTPSVIAIQKLPDVVVGKDRAFARAQAMVQLAESEHPDREALLSQMLENTYEPRRYKAVAAITLGRIATPLAEEILIRNLPKTWDDAFSEVLRSLGRIGGSVALEAIESLELPPRHSDVDAVAYAATLIAHRLGLPGRELPFPTEQELLERPAKGTRSIEFAAVKRTTARAVLDGLKQCPYGIAFDPGTLTSIRCGGQSNVVCPNREFLGKGAEQLTQRKAVLALLAVQSRETGAYSASYVVLSRPSGAGTIAIMIHRCSGKLTLAGTVCVSDGSFELRTVRQLGARAVYMKGTVNDHGRFRVTEAVSCTMPEQRRMPAYHIGW